MPWPEDLATLHRRNPARYPFLLESVADGNGLGRYDLLFAFPQATLRLDAGGTVTGPEAGGDGFLAAFDRWHRAETVSPAVCNDRPFTGGWFLMLGYELAAEIEPSLALPVDPVLPVALATRIPTAVIRDRRTRQAWIIAEPAFAEQTAAIAADLAADPGKPGDQAPGTSLPVEEPLLEDKLTEEDPELFRTAVRRAQRHIVAGDIFQANLSRQWSGRLRAGVRPADIYERLRLTNPAPFAGLAVFEDMAVISSSPERLLRIRDGIVETRPIAGTRPRGPDQAADTPARVDLLGDPKERAEHIMVIDLERNDLGRICRAGSVTVDEFMVLESYSHVHHIVSNIRGRLDDRATPGRIIAAMFPGGSITGCPKVRCMQIISELEGRPRGVYTGAMGYMNRDGSGDLSILIRSLTMTGPTLSLATGCGIVTDSDPDRELAETRAKARGLLLALGSEAPADRERL